MNARLNCQISGWEAQAKSLFFERATFHVDGLVRDNDLEFIMKAAALYGFSVRVTGAEYLLTPNAQGEISDDRV